MQIWKKHFGKEGPLRSIPNSEGIRRVKSLAHDAMRFLERAEPVLRERRRNVWWTTWFFERRLRTIAALLWCSALEWEKEEPIPFLGLEAKMRKTETVADELLSDAVRMIRVDCYRLATAIEAYAHCARALQLRLKWDGKADPLPERSSKLKELLDKALTQLDGA